MFFCDVFVRRVAIHFGWVKNAWDKAMSVFGRTEEKLEPSRISRLQSRKAEIGKKYEERRAATRFEPDSDTLKESGSGQQQLDSVIESERRKETQAPPAARADANVENDDQPAYTSRLLDAKRRAQKKRDKD